MTYRGRVAVVTGAGSGIGRALTIALTTRGAQVAASDVDDEGLAGTVAACPDGAVRPYHLDVADRAAVLQHADDVRDELGPASLVFNNAGVGLYADVADTSWADWDWLIGINLGGVVNGSKAFLPHLIETGSRQHPARLVNISSVFGLISVPAQSAYNTAKFGVRGFTEALQQELIVGRHPVTAHSVHPGAIRTNIAVNTRTTQADADREAFAKQFEKAARTTPDKAARVIVRGVERNSPRILVGPDAYVVAALPRLLGIRYTVLTARAMRLIVERTRKT